MRHRRDVLAAAGAALAAGLAGCTDGGENGDPGGFDPDEETGGDGNGEEIGSGGDDGTGGDGNGEEIGSGGDDGDDGGEIGSGEGEDGDEAAGDGIESEPLPDRGDETHLEGVETREHDDVRHVADESRLEYDERLPTGGPHLGDVVAPGVYEEPQSPGALVHNLEHGHVVVYYDPAAISPGARESLERFAAAHDDTWAAVVVVPNPRDEPRSAYVLTAWGARLRLDEYDARVVRAFLAEYVGRGPEYPVRRIAGR